MNKELQSYQNDKNETAQLMYGLAVDIYDAGRTIGGKTYKGFEFINFQTAVIRATVEICFILLKDHGDVPIWEHRIDHFIDEYVLRNKLGIEQRRVRALIKRLYVPIADNPHELVLMPQIKSQLYTLSDIGSNSLECEYQIIESAITDISKTVPVRSSYRRPFYDEIWEPPIEEPPVKYIPKENLIESYQNTNLYIAIDTITSEIYKRIIKDPQTLKNMSWQQVEDLVFNIFKDFGYEVEQTRRTKDGGIDVFAIHRSKVMGPELYLVQVKHWRGKIDVRPIRELAFLHTHHQASKSCLATTSLFTKGAIELFDQYRWILEPRDFYGILDWVKQAWKLLKN